MPKAISYQPWVERWLRRALRGTAGYLAEHPDLPEVFGRLHGLDGVLDGRARAAADHAAALKAALAAGDAHNAAWFARRLAEEESEISLLLPHGARGSSKRDAWSVAEHVWESLSHSKRLSERGRARVSKRKAAHRPVKWDHEEIRKRALHHDKEHPQWNRTRVRLEVQGSLQRGGAYPSMRTIERATSLERMPPDW